MSRTRGCNGPLSPIEDAPARSRRGERPATDSSRLLPHRSRLPVVCVAVRTALEDFTRRNHHGRQQEPLGKRRPAQPSRRRLFKTASATAGGAEILGVLQTK